MANRLQGDRDLQQAFAALNQQDQNRIAWSAARKGALVVKEKIEQNYISDDSSTPINVQDFVAVQRATRRAKKDQVVSFRIGIRGTAKTPDSLEERNNPKSPYYWRMIEFGTQYVPARPFVRPAAEQSVSRVYMTVGQEVWKGIDRVLRRIKRTGR